MIDLREQLSEFSYGYGIVRDTQKYLESVGLNCTPYLPSLVIEKQVGFDVAFKKPGSVLMLQFKLGRQLERFRRNQPGQTIPSKLERPFWRFSIETSDPSNQFNVLLIQEKAGAEAYYVAPKFSLWTEYVAAFESSEVLDRSVLVPISEIERGKIASPALNGRHDIVYDFERKYVCSEPVEIKTPTIGDVAEQIRGRIASKHTLSERIEQIFDATAFGGIPSEAAQLPKRDMPSRLRRYDQLLLSSKSEDEARARFIALENWISGAQTLFVTEI